MKVHATNLDAEVNDLTSKLSEAVLDRTDLITSHTNEKHDLNVAKNAAIHDMASYWVSYVSDTLLSELLIDHMQNKFGLTISSSLFPPFLFANSYNVSSERRAIRRRCIFRQRRLDNRRLSGSNSRHQQRRFNRRRSCFQ